MHRADKGVHGKASAGNSESLDERVKTRASRDFAVSAAADACQKSFDCGRGGWPSRSDAFVGRAKRQSFNLYRSSVFLNSLVEELSEIAGPLTEWSAKRR